MRGFLLSVLSFCLVACICVSELLAMDKYNESQKIQIDTDVKDAVMTVMEDHEVSDGETLLADGEESIDDPSVPNAVPYSDTASSNPDATSNPTSPLATPNPMRRKVDFTELKSINSDVDCWIYVPNTHIDYYVMQEQEPEVYYYLWRNVYQQQSEWGSIFKPAYPNMDTLLDAHQLIFGHHMAYGSVAFSDLMSYHDKSYAEKWPNIYLYYPDRVERWKVWTAGTVNPYDALYTVPYELNSADYDNLLSHLDEIGEYSLRSNRPRKSERTTILSTCDNTNGFRFFIATTWAETYYYNRADARNAMRT